MSLNVDLRLSEGWKGDARPHRRESSGNPGLRRDRMRRIRVCGKR